MKLNNNDNLYIANQKYISLAIEKILSGDIIIYPTDTLYSFGADATNSDAIYKINKIKGRKSPLSIILKNLNDIHDYAKIEENTLMKINTILPGPYTILLESKNNPKLSSHIQCESKLIGIRIIDNKFCNSIIRKINRPIVTTSVNVHGQNSLVNINDIKNQFHGITTFYSKKRLISNGSTIIDFSIMPESIIRKGAGKY